MDIIYIVIKIVSALHFSDKKTLIVQFLYECY